MVQKTVLVTAEWTEVYRLIIHQIDTLNILAGTPIHMTIDAGQLPPTCHRTDGSLDLRLPIAFLLVKVLTDLRLLSQIKCYKRATLLSLISLVL